MTARMIWSGISLGVFFLSLGVLVTTGAPWQWIFVVCAGMSLVNAVVKRRWRFAPHPLMWGSALSYAYVTGMSGWGMFWGLCGASVIVGFLVGLIPRSPPPPPPPARPGAGIVIDVEPER